ncbi:MAG: helix-turn-helix transcriptional regulator [Saprospiraceae bacterium]
MEFSNNSEYLFGNNLRFLRKSKKMTLLELSKSIQVSKSALSDYETYKTIPSLDVVKKFSNFFNIPMDALYNSDISEILKKNKMHSFKQDLQQENKILDHEKYTFNLKLLTQKLESTQLQIQMLKQLLASKESENMTLGINIKLLEERIKLLDHSNT